MPRRRFRRYSTVMILDEADEIFDKASRAAFERLRDKLLMIRVERYADSSEPDQIETVIKIIDMLKNSGKVIVSLFQSGNYIYIRFVDRKDYESHCKGHSNYVPVEELEKAVNMKLEKMKEQLAKLRGEVKEKEMEVTVTEEGVKVNEGSEEEEVIEGEEE